MLKLGCVCVCVYVCVCVFAHALLYVCVVVVQSLTCPTLSDPKDCIQHARLPCRSTSPGVCSNSWPLSSKMPSNHHVLCHPLLLLPSIFPTIRVLSNGLALHTRWPKHWSFSFSISFSREYSGLISFWTDCVPADFYYLAIKSTLEPATTLPSPQWNQNFLLQQIKKKMQLALSPGWFAKANFLHSHPFTVSFLIFFFFILIICL